MNMKIVSVINYKGGVGKTTLTANLAAELAHQGTHGRFGSSGKSDIFLHQS